MKTYRSRIGQSAQTIAFVLGIPLNTYIEFEDGHREAPKSVLDAFFNLLVRYPGSVDFSKPTIDAICTYKKTYLSVHHQYPEGWHQIPAPWLSRKTKLINLSPYSVE